MNHDELINLDEEYTKIIRKLDSNSLSTYSKNEIARNSGLESERRIFDVLNRYCDKVFSSVVLWNKEHNFVTEMDFVAFIKGIVLIIEVKHWYGKMYYQADSTTVNLNYVNHSGKNVNQSRTNPLYSTSAFKKDLINYFKRNDLYIFKDLLLKIVIFTRDEFEIANPEKNLTKVLTLKINELTDYLEKVRNEELPHNYNLPQEMPSWDKSLSNQGAFYTAILNDTIQLNETKIPTSEISTITFDTNFELNSLIKTVNGQIYTGFIDRAKIELIGNKKLSHTGIKHISLNSLLHKFLP